MIMPTVAEQLRTSREAQGLTVYQVAEVTKIRTDHVRALEEGKFEAFAAPVYVRGFVRTYATLLKLDVPGMMSQLEGSSTYWCCNWQRWTGAWLCLRWARPWLC